MAGAAAAAVASGISARPAAPRRASTGRRARLSVVRAAISLEKGEKAYTVQKSEEIFNAAKVPVLSDSFAQQLLHAVPGFPVVSEGLVTFEV